MASALKLAASREDPAPVAARAELTVSALHKRYGVNEVLRGSSFSQHAGEAIALIGGNGAGKSTLLRCCLRLVDYDGGEVVLLGQRVGDLRRPALRRLRAQVGFVFQRHNLVPRLSALSNTLHGIQARTWGPGGWHQGLAPAPWRAEAMACLEQVGLADRALRRADQLSGGESQRVAIARALMQRPRMMLADEPVASLDPSAGEEVMALFVRLMREQRVTLLFTTHDLRHAVEYADRIIGLQDGVVALDEPAARPSVHALKRIYEHQDHG